MDNFVHIEFLHLCDELRTKTDVLGLVALCSRRAEDGRVALKAELLQRNAFDQRDLLNLAELRGLARRSWYLRIVQKFAG